MSVEKSFTEFIILHEQKAMTKEVDALENSIVSSTNRSSSILGNLAASDLDEATEVLIEGINLFKKVLAKHQLYNIS